MGRTVAIIPARGGSKRISNKNVRLFCGRPIIVYSIEAAIRSGLFSRVIVTTDSSEIAGIAVENGAEVPFVRPPELADDHTPTADVLAHALQWIAENDEAGVCAHACCIYATAPFVTVGALQDGYDALVTNSAGSAFPVTSFPFPPLRGLRIQDDGSLAMIWPEHELTRSQDLPEAYHDAGQFYWVDCQRFGKDHRLYAIDARPVVLPRYLVQDIDTEEDWVRAEMMYELCRSRGLI